MVLNWFWRYNEFGGITLQNKNKKRVGWKYFFIELCSIFIYKVTVTQVILYGKVLMFQNNKTRRKEMFYLMMHSTHFIYGCMASDIWFRTTQWERKPAAATWATSFQLVARVLLYAIFHRQDNTYPDGAVHMSLAKGLLVLGSHLGISSSPRLVFKGPMGRCKATTFHSTLLSH